MKLMKQEKQQKTALMHYGAIAPMIAELDKHYPNKIAFYTEISAKEPTGPDEKLHHYTPATIENGIWTISTMFLKVSSRKGGQMQA